MRLRSKHMASLSACQSMDNSPNSTINVSQGMTQSTPMGWWKPNATPRCGRWLCHSKHQQISKIRSNYHKGCSHGALFHL